MKEIETRGGARAFTVDELSSAKLVSPDTIHDWGRTLIVAPHPDDESLGCGGALALLAARSNAAFVLILTDGAASHAQSKEYPQPRLRELRERETLLAIGHLGHDQSAVTFMRFDDRRLPSDANHEADSSCRFDDVVNRCRDYLAQLAPHTIFVPWRRDPHPDHRATAKIVTAACQGLFATSPRIIEYPIWIWEMNEGGDAPLASEVTPWRLDVSSVIERKRRAIASHVSQTTDLIKDDPNGFRLSAEVLQNFSHPWELYFDSK